MTETKEIKQAVAKINLDKINAYLAKNPNSWTLKRIIRHTKEIEKSPSLAVVFKLAVKLAYYLDAIINKTDYIKDPKEKEYWLKLAKELFGLTVGVKEETKK